jgi:hypothetical protein
MELKDLSLPFDDFPQLGLVSSSYEFLKELLHFAQYFQ